MGRTPSVSSLVKVSPRTTATLLLPLTSEQPLPPAPHRTWAWVSHRQGGRPSLPRLKIHFQVGLLTGPKAGAGRCPQGHMDGSPPREPKEECHLSLCSESSDASLGERGSLLLETWHHHRMPSATRRLGGKGRCALSGRETARGL